MSVIIKKSFLLVCAILIASLPISASFKNVNALSETVLDEYAQNNILFYDPDENCDSSTQGTTYCTPPNGSEITWIGDSYSILAKDLIDSTFSGVDYNGPITDSNKLGDGNTYIASGKCVDQAGIDSNVSNNPSGLDILKNLKDGGKLRPYVVFALGTNKGWTQSMIDKMLGIVGDSTQVILVTSKTYNSTHGISDNSTSGLSGGNYEAGNALLKKAAEEHTNIHVADWAAAYKDEYFSASNSGDDGIHPGVGDGYKTWIQTIKSAIPTNCSAGLLPGKTVEEKIWNYFVRANIEGISNDPLVIAGILGNFYVESGYNPFLYSSAGGGYFHGLHMLDDNYGGTELKSAVDAAVGKDLWMYYYDSDVQNGFTNVDDLLSSRGITEQQIDAGITASMDFYFKGEAGGKPLTSNTALATKTNVDSFIQDLGKVANKTPTAYAELFLVWVERAVTSPGGPYNPSPITDSGVAQVVIQNNLNSSTYYQGTDQRDKAAEDVYSRLSNMTTPTTTASSGSMTSGGTNVAAASSGGYKKYDDLTDAELWDLAELAMAENGGTITAFKNTLSITANLFEKNGSGDNGHSLWLYAKDGGWFAGGTAAQINGQKDRSDIESKHIDAAREVLMNGNRTLPTQILEFDCVGDLDWVELDGKKYTASNPGNCNGTGLNEEQYYVSGKTKVHNVYGAEYIFYGWMGGEFGNGDPMGYFADNPPSETVTTVSSGNSNNNCPSSNENKTSASGGTSIAKAAISMAWPVQADQNDDEHVGKCKDSDGSWKPYSTANYPNTCATNPRDLYRQQLDTWLPGDNGMDCGKYVTTVLRYAKAADTTASADLENYFKGDSNWEKLSDPSTSNLKPGDVFFQPGHVAIYIGDYGGTYGPIASASLDERVGQVTPYYNESSTTSAWRYKGSVGEGLTPEQAEKLAENYNNNVGNWDGKVAQEGNYCQDYNCASRYSNCVLFSAFFTEMFTDVGFGFGYPGGPDVVGKLKEMGFKTGSEPKPYSVFSTTGFHGSYHTGVVVAVDGDKIATVEAGYPSWPAAYHDFEDPGDVWIEYAYLDERMDYSKLMDYINK